MAQQGDPPPRIGIVVVAPPGMSMPPETGYTPFWEQTQGLLYASNEEAANVDLSPGSFIKYRLKQETASSGNEINVAYDISNF